MPASLNAFIYILSFIAIWLGAGLIISSVEQFSRKLKLSSFVVSFFILGILTSIPEFAVGMTAISENDPEVFIGNLLGGIPVLFLLVIPLLAIFGKGIKLNHNLDNPSLLLTLIVIGAPSFLIIDKKVTNLEGIVFLVIYFVLLIVVEMKKGLFDHKNTKVIHMKYYSTFSILKIIVGVVLVFIASHFIVDETLYFAQFFNISPFYLSLIALSLGTNAPELSIAVRSVVSGKKDVAFGDYLGSAAANTLLFGLFTLMTPGEIYAQDHFLTTFLFIAGGLTLFYYFSLSKNSISRREGVVLLLVYFLFIIVEYF